MPADRTDERIAALDRGIHLLEFLIRQGRACRYQELAQQVPEASNSTVSRLLRALEASEAIRKTDDGAYALSRRVQEWALFLPEVQATFQQKALQCVEALSDGAGESVAVAVLEHDRIRVVASRTVPEAVSVMRVGGVLQFEPDHAGALATLDQLTPQEREPLYASQFSHFSGEAAFKKAVAEARAHPHFLDRSRARPGICRFAAGFRAGDRVGSLFFCLTIQQAKKRQEYLGSLLDHGLRLLLG